VGALTSFLPLQPSCPAQAEQSLCILSAPASQIERHRQAVMHCSITNSSTMLSQISLECCLCRWNEILLPSTTILFNRISLHRPETQDGEPVTFCSFCILLCFSYCKRKQCTRVSCFADEDRTGQSKADAAHHNCLPQNFQAFRGGIA
jgi:hypothetical protein